MRAQATAHNYLLFITVPICIYLLLSWPKLQDWYSKQLAATIQDQHFQQLLGNLLLIIWGTHQSLSYLLITTERKATIGYHILLLHPHLA